MTDLPANVDLQWIGKTLLAIQAEQAYEMLVLGARVERVEAGLAVILAEVRALTHQIARINKRIEKVD